MKHMVSGFTSTYLSLVLLLVFTACDKEKYSVTKVRGRVLKGASNKPLEDAAIYISASWENKDGSDGAESFYGKTDQTGQFNLEFSTVEGASLLMDVSKNGFIGKPFYYPLGGSDNFISAYLFAVDGHLRLKMVNETGQHDSLYVNLVSPTIRAISDGWGYTNHPQKYPLLLAKDSSWTQVFGFPSEEHIYLSWGYSKNAPPFSGDIFLPKSDTVDYIIAF